MKSIAALASLSVALPFAAAAPHAAPSAGHTLMTASLNSKEISKRDDIPEICKAMIDTRQQGAPEWYFYWFNDIKDACAVEERSGQRNCGEDGYWDTQLDDMVKAIDDQTTKDGQFESSTVGMWRATFATLTSAVANRSGFSDFASKILRESIPNDNKARYWSYRFIFDGDIIHLNLDNGGIFTPNCPDAA